MSARDSPWRPRVLEPGDRIQLAELLRPPPGTRLTAAVGTTYTLDLDAFLAVPAVLAAAGIISEPNEDEGADPVEPVALLESVRRHAGLITVFCQAGGIRLPPRRREVFAWLEDAVIECGAPNGGVFHPKTWTLRFDADEPGVAESYRFVCLSRNLTFDSSWDTAVRLDSRPSGAEQTGDAQGAPLGRFLRGVLSCANAGARVSDERIRTTERLAQAVEGVSFARPEGVDAVELWPMGFAGCPPPATDSRASRCLVCAPFLSAGGVERFASGSDDDVVISTAEALSRLPAGSARGFDERFVLSADADPVERADEERVRESLRGLHAKLFVIEHGKQARLITGSPNATDAAFSKNVEFAVEVRGHRQALGIDALMVSEPGELRLRDLLVPYDPDAIDGDGEALANAEWALEQLATQWVGARWLATVEAAAEGYSLRVSTERDLTPPSFPCVATMWPVTLPSAAAAAVKGEARVQASFGVSVSAITSFIAVRLEADVAAGTVEKTFVLNAELIGAPPDRHDLILAELLLNGDKFVEYLLLLLADRDDGIGLGDGSAAWAGLMATAAGWDGGTPPLLEVLVRAASRSPGSLRHVDGLVRALRRTEAGQRVLPPGFMDVWGAVWDEAEGADRGAEN